MSETYSKTLYWRPDYYWKRNDWIKWRDLYDGKHDILVGKTYLIPHSFEEKDTDTDSQKIRSGREKRTRYLNLMEMLTSVWQTIFFKKKPNFADLEDFLGDRLDNIDGQGTSFFSFIRDCVLRDLLLYGKTVILASNSPEQAQTLADETGVVPYLKALCPLDVTDWDLETQDPLRVGKFNMLRHEFNLLAPRTDSSVKPEMNRFCHVYKRISAAQVTVDIYKIPLNYDLTIPQQYLINMQDLSQGWISVGTVDLSLSEIPACFIDGDSWLKDAAEECLRAFNLRSNRDNILYYQGYCQDFITGVDPTNTALRAAVSEYIRLLLPEGANLGRLQPVPTTDIDRNVQEAIDLTFKVGLNMFRTIPADSRVGQSADSMSQEKDNPVSLVEATIESLENLVNQALAYMGEFMGKEAPEVEFCKEISEESFQRFITVVQSLSRYLTGYTEADKAIAKRAVAYMGLDDKEAKLINDQVDKGIKEQPQTQPFQKDLFRQAINGNGAGKASTANQATGSASTSLPQ